MTREQIGQITLDYKYYPGEDYYCDGEIENTLLEIVQNNPPSSFPAIIEERASWPILYHLSPLRENIVSWLPLDKSMKVLEVGAGCGAITGALAGKAGSVTCIDLSRKRSIINAYRHQDCGNVTIHVGNFKHIEPELPCDFDYIFLIGVFEYAQGYMGTQEPYEDFMAILKKHLKRTGACEGKLVIAIENKFGLKYWAGCREDHTGRLFDGIEDYPSGSGARTFTRNGLEKLCAKNHITDYAFYYPYPDYKFMTTLYSDKRLPMPGELSTNLRNFDRSRLLLFDEKNAFDTIIKEEQFPLYSNSYLLITGQEPALAYTKYSNDRAKQFAIRTDLVQDENGRKWIEKTPMTEEAAAHIDNILRWYELLRARYEGSGLHINECHKRDGALQFTYIEGKTLETVLDEYLDRDDMEGFAAMLEQFRNLISYRNENSAAVTDYDVVFSNILIQNNEWYLIDYEWTQEREIETQELLIRALYFYIISSQKRGKLKDNFIIQRFGLTDAAFADITEKEKRFQQYVTGSRLSMIEMHGAIGEPMVTTGEMEAHYFGRGGILDYSVQIYTDNGGGFAEETSYFLEKAYEDAHHISFSLDVGADMQAVRIDPAMTACLVMVEELNWNGRPVPTGRRCLETNGTSLGRKTILFATSDPNLVIHTRKLRRKETNVLRVRLKMVRVPEEIAAQMAEAENRQKGL